MPKTTAKSARNITQAKATRRHAEGLTARNGRQRLEAGRPKKAGPGRKRPVATTAEGCGAVGERKAGPGASRTAADDSSGPPRKGRRGARGAAPWAARHAAKQAAEAAARNAAPPPPGSARATLRIPEAADEIKERVRQLHVALARIAGLQRNLTHSFYEVGLMLAEIRALCLYEAKGYSNLESFLDREVSLGRVQGTRLLRIVETFKPEAAQALGYDVVLAALAAIDDCGSTRPSRPLEPPGPGSVGTARQR